MSKTLVIKGANYATNALDTISFARIPCTAIALSQSAVEITSIGGTYTIVPTLTPANTTDEVIWTSSDEDIATVSDGVVTTVALGTAVITATCGEQSATCTITVKAFMTNATGVLMTSLGGTSKYAGGNGLPTLPYNADWTRYGSLVSSSGNLHFSAETSGTMYYPYNIPESAKRIKITTPTGDYALKAYTLQFLSTSEAASTSYPEVACLIDQIQGSGLAPTSGEITVNIPERDGLPTVNAIAITLMTMSSSVDFDSSYFENVVVEFLPASTT